MKCILVNTAFIITNSVCIYFGDSLYIWLHIWLIKSIGWTIKGDEEITEKCFHQHQKCTEYVVRSSGSRFPVSVRDCIRHGRRPGRTLQHPGEGRCSPPAAMPRTPRLGTAEPVVRVRLVVCEDSVTTRLPLLRRLCLYHMVCGPLTPGGQDYQTLCYQIQQWLLPSSHLDTWEDREEGTSPEHPIGLTGGTAHGTGAEESPVTLHVWSHGDEAIRKK